jgi:hypothetical protein
MGQRDPASLIRPRSTEPPHPRFLVIRRKGSSCRWLFLQEISSQRDVVSHGIPGPVSFGDRKNSQAPAVLPLASAVFVEAEVAKDRDAGNSFRATT